MSPKGKQICTIYTTENLVSYERFLIRDSRQNYRGNCKHFIENLSNSIHITILSKKYSVQKLLKHHFCLDQALLKTMRQHQTMAMESMLSITDNKRLKSLIGEVVGRMKKVIVSSKSIVETAKFQPSNDVFPTEDPLRESVAKIIENTAFYFELTVYLPVNFI